VIVGGSSRKSGKTSAICSIIASTPDALWTALKITSHEHGGDLTQPVVQEELEPGEDNDTSRYLRAGARRALWIRCRPEHLLSSVSPYLSDNVIMESNTAALLFTDALVVYVQGGPDKESATAVSKRSDYKDVDSAIEAIRRRLSGRSGVPWR
jgi:hypothetical protein